MSDLSTIWQDGFLDFGKVVAQWCREKKVGFKEMGTMSGIRMAMVTTYQIMVGKKMCLPIEEIKQETKIELWNEAKMNCPDKSKWLDYCKATWALENLL